MRRGISADQLMAGHAIRLAATPVLVKSGLGFALARNGKAVHRINRMTVAYAEGRVRYYADWVCGERSWDALPVVGTAPSGLRPCKQCESVAKGPFVYRCYDATGQVLYIGSAKCRLTRLQNHRNSSPWWPQVAWVEITDQPDTETARREEAAAIKAESPIHNKQHNITRFRHEFSRYVPLASVA